MMSFDFLSRWSMMFFFFFLVRKMVNDVGKTLSSDKKSNAYDTLSSSVYGQDDWRPHTSYVESADHLFLCVDCLV